MKNTKSGFFLFAILMVGLLSCDQKSSRKFPPIKYNNVAFFHVYLDKNKCNAEQSFIHGNAYEKANNPDPLFQFEIDDQFLRITQLGNSFGPVDDKSIDTKVEFIVPLDCIAFYRIQTKLQPETNSSPSKTP